MKIALVTDELHPINKHVAKWLEDKGFECTLFGSYLTRVDAPSWVEAIAEAAQAVSSGQCDEGVFFCWSGTGASMVANKTKGLRAALCTEPETAQLARLWNHANVLVLSNRSLTPEVTNDILNAWFEPYDQEKGRRGVKDLRYLDNVNLK